MNKSEIKQIILEEIETTLQEMNKNMSPEELAAQSFIDDEELDDERASDIEGPGYEDMPGAKVTPFVTDLEARIARAMETGDEDELEDLAAGELDRAGLDEMARTANVFALAKEASIKDVLQFMQRVNDVLKTYKSPGQKRPKKRFTPEEMKALAKVMLQDGGFTSKDIIAATSYSSPAQANKFLAALEQKGLIKLTSQLKKSMAPERDPNAPETRGRKAKSAEFDVPDDALDMDFGDFEDLDLGDIGALEENNNTMSELEKYIKKAIKEAKNPLASKMKEIENQGRIAALETKLAAIAEMIDETNQRLTRIDEDSEFKEMLDKGAVKEVRKQLKELERAQAKLQKEYNKVAGGRRREKVVDELDAEETRAKADKFDDLADRQDALDQEAGEVEEVSFELNESVKRMQKLANLKG